MLCRRLPGEIILFAYKLVVVQDVELFAGGQLFPTHEAREAVEMEHLFASLADQVRRRDAVPTTTAFCTVSPVNKGHNFKCNLNCKRLYKTLPVQSVHTKNDS